MFSRNLIFTSFIKRFISNDQEWITIIILIVLFLIALLFASNRRKMLLMMQSLFSSRHFSQLNREGKVFAERFYLLILILYVLVQGLFCYLLVKYFFPVLYSRFIPFFLFLITTSCVVADYIIKLLLTALFTWLFDCVEERTNYYLYKLFAQTINSILLFFILVGVIYTGYIALFIIYGIIFAVTFAVMAYRLFTLNPQKINLFHFFVYFCTFEILPYLVVLKFLFLLDQQAF